MADRRRAPRNFIHGQDMVATRVMTFLGKDYTAGDVLPEVDKGMALRLWMSRRADYKNEFNPTPIEQPTLSDPFELINLKNGYYTVAAPWLDEPISIKGKKKAATLQAKMQNDGAPLDHHGVAIIAGEAKLLRVKAEWIEIPFGDYSMDDAAYVAARLREAGPFSDESLGCGIAGLLAGQFAVVAPWLEVYNLVESEEMAIEQAQELRNAGPPQPEIDPALAALEAGNGEGGEGDGTTEINEGSEGGEEDAALTAVEGAGDATGGEGVTEGAEGGDAAKDQSEAGSGDNNDQTVDADVVKEGEGDIALSETVDAVEASDEE